MASIVMRGMRDEEADKAAKNMLKNLYKRPCLCGCPYEDLCGVKNIGSCKVARAIRKRLILTDEWR